MVIVIGPGTSLLSYSRSPVTGQLTAACPNCAATVELPAGGSWHDNDVWHKPGCGFRAMVEQFLAQSATRSNA